MADTGDLIESGKRMIAASRMEARRPCDDYALWRAMRAPRMRGKSHIT